MLNTVILMGRITQDLELKQTQNGTSVLSFNVAVDRGYVKQGEERQTDFITCVAWRQTAEFISKYFSKGRMIALEGNLRTRTYDDKNGSKHYVTRYMYQVLHLQVNLSSRAQTIIPTITLTAAISRVITSRITVDISRIIMDIRSLQTKLTRTTITIHRQMMLYPLGILQILKRFLPTTVFHSNKQNKKREAASSKSEGAASYLISCPTHFQIAFSFFFINVLIFLTRQIISLFFCCSHIISPN